MISVPSVVGMSLVGPHVIEIISTAETAESSRLLLPIIAAGMVLWGLDELYGLIPVAEEETIKVSKIRGIAAGVNVLLNVALVPTVGILGAAVSTLLAYGASALWLYQKTNSEIDAKFDWPAATRIVAASGLMFVTAHLFFISNFITTLFIAPGIYFLGLVVLGEVRPFSLLSTYREIRS